MIEAKDLSVYATNYFKKKAKKLSFCLELQVQVEEITLSGDEVELKFLLENLMNEALDYEADGVLKLHIHRENDFVRFDFTDTRRAKTQEELNLLFDPHLSRMRREDEGTLIGTEYLICKQVIREHDEYTGKRGCRINAQAAWPEGFTVWFTVPVASKKK